MTIKHKVLKDFQFITPDKKIFTLKANIVLEEYTYKSKNDVIEVDRDIIDNNPDYFSIIDWKSELLTHLKLEKVPQPSQVSKKLIPFIEEMFVLGDKEDKTDDSKLKELEKEYKLKIKDVERKERELEDTRESIESSQEEIESKLREISKKEKDMRDKEENLKDREIEIRDMEKKKEREIKESLKDLEQEEKDIDKKIKDRMKDIEKKEKDVELMKESYQKKIDHIMNGISRFKNDYPDLYEKYKINPNIILDYVKHK